EAFGGQFLCIDTLPIENQEQSKNRYGDDSQKMTDYVTAFSDRYYSKIEQWQHELERMRTQNHRAVVWGAGSKGVTFLNTLKVQDQIEYIVDISPAKQGMHVSGTGQKIVPPEFLRKYRPDTIIVMNPIYIKEIQSLAKNMNVDSKFMVV
ncbi:MAG: hypothetical protein KAT27_11265, partial [Desulfobacterales bacterium]|nr:hypothetical protein [Desulfobacterales bacterium]